MFKVSSELMGKMPPLYIITLPSLVTIDNAMADMFLSAEGQRLRMLT